MTPTPTDSKPMKDSGANGSPYVRPQPGPLRIGMPVALIAVLADQITKALMISAVMSPPRVIPVTPFFNLILTFNRGVSFSLLSSDSAFGPWALSALALAIVFVLLWMMVRSRNTWEAVGLGAIVGGALGNVIDRIRQGAVTDFLDFYAGDWHWPAFNMADVAIATGVALLLVHSLFGRAIVEPAGKAR